VAPRSNLAVRVLTSVGLLPLLLALLFLGPAWAWYLLVLAACAVASAELFAMTHPGDRVAQTVGVATTLGVSVTVYQMTANALALMTLVMAVSLIGALVPLWRLGDIKTSALRMMVGIAGPLYLGVLLTTLGLLRRDHGSLGSSYVFMALGFAWLGDTGGYFFGKYLGRRKLYPAVSPKKTVAGLMGAIAGASLGGLGVHLWLLPSVPLTHAAGLGTLAGGLGQLGDLAESLLKRSVGVKDSGSVIPGHGGLLDRVDALLVIAPIVYLYATWHGP
jgi:phosphatidate cytidylyltransferase